MGVTRFRMVQVAHGKTENVEFPGDVLNASAAVQSFTLSFGDKDHHLRTMNVKASMDGISGTNVVVGATCYMEDKSDNHAHGQLGILVIAECDV